MKLPRPSGLTLLTAALLVLLPALAVLQYRWVGQVSDAERERMQRNLRNAALQFRDAFDVEVGRAVLSLQVGPVTARDGASEQYTDRYEAWVETSEHPRIVSDIFVVDAVGPDLRLRKFDPESHVFEPVAWPEAIARWRLDFDRQLRDFNAGRPVDRRFGLTDEESLVISPLRNLIGPGSPGARPASITQVFGFTILQLDVRYMRDEILPALARRYFIHQDGDSYRVAVVSTSDPSRVLYRSDTDAPTNPAGADASELFFGPRAGPRLFFGRGGGGGVRLGGQAGPLDDRRRTGGDLPPRDEDMGRWRLVVQHASGSLETAVASARRRNLAISFGVLLLLTVSVALLTATTRKAHRLAHPVVGPAAGAAEEVEAPGRQRQGGVGELDVERGVRIGSIEGLRRLPGVGDGHAIAIGIGRREVALGELRQHRLADVAHVELQDREAEDGGDRLRSVAGDGRRDQVAQRGDDQRLVVGAEQAPGVEGAAGVEGGQLEPELRLQPFERLRPGRRVEGVRLEVPAAQAELVGDFRVDQIDVCNDLGVCRRINPRVIPAAVLLRRPLTGGGGSDGEAEQGAGQLAFIGVAELTGGVPQVALHALAFGDADLPDPAVLQDGERRE